MKTPDFDTVLLLLNHGADPTIKSFKLKLTPGFFLFVFYQPNFLATHIFFQLMLQKKQITKILQNSLMNTNPLPLFVISFFHSLL